MGKGQTKVRRNNQLRPLRFTRRFTEFAAGSVLVEMGRTRVLCTASFQQEVPQWRKESGLGWVTAEYSMLPTSTPQRKARPKDGHTDSRGIEIQRLIGRALRAIVDFEALGANTIAVDCDVLQADGGTRTAAINGSCVAVMDAVEFALKQGWLEENPIKAALAAVSVGMVDDQVCLDLDYEQDSRAQVDMNVVMTDKGEFVEVQGTGEQSPFSASELDAMLRMARSGIKKILAAQKTALTKEK